MHSLEGGSMDSPSDSGTRYSESAEAAKERATHVGDRLKQRADEVKHEVRRTAHDMGAHARSAANEQKHLAAERVAGIAHAIRSASDDLNNQGQPLMAEYTRHLAEGVEGIADSLGRRDFEELVGGVEDFARQRPAAFLGGTMTAGFALARFMKSSAAHRHERDYDKSPSGRSYYGSGSEISASGRGPNTPTSPTGAPTTPGVERSVNASAGTASAPPTGGTTTPSVSEVESGRPGRDQAPTAAADANKESPHAAR